MRCRELFGSSRCAELLDVPVWENDSRCRGDELKQMCRLLLAGTVWVSRPRALLPVCDRILLQLDWSIRLLALSFGLLDCTLRPIEWVQLPGAVPSWQAEHDEWTATLSVVPCRHLLVGPREHVLHELSDRDNDS